MYGRRDPGPCAVCGAAHSACTTTPAATTPIAQLPQRDAAAPSEAAAPDVAPEPAPLPAGIFTTGAYRRPKPSPHPLKE